MTCKGERSPSRRTTSLRSSSKPRSRDPLLGCVPSRAQHAGPAEAARFTTERQYPCAAKYHPCWQALQQYQVSFVKLFVKSGTKCRKPNEQKSARTRSRLQTWMRSTEVATCMALYTTIDPKGNLGYGSPPPNNAQHAMVLHTCVSSNKDYTISCQHPVHQSKGSRTLHTT